MGPKMNDIERFLCLTSCDRGYDFLRKCAALGVRPTVLTLDQHRDAPWPREAVEDLATMPGGLNREQILNTVSWMMRGRRFDRVIALDEADLETAAQIREHLRIPGMGTTTAGCYRDRLAMRVIARAFGHPVREFCRVLNYDELRAFTSRVTAPWLLMPRTGNVERQMRRIDHAEQLWRTLDSLVDAQSRYLLEQHLPGEIFVAASIVSEREVRFQAIHQARSAQLEQGVPASMTSVGRETKEWKELAALNAAIAPSMGMVRGLTHAAYLRSSSDGRWYFLEIAAGVPGSGIVERVESETGINLCVEWARLEVSELRGETYGPPDVS